MDKEQLQQALKVFEPWLNEEAQAAELAVASTFNARTSSLPEVAERVGLARGLGAVAGLLRDRIDRMP